MPEPGLVLRYAHLWAREQDAGQEEGKKDRPCAVVLVVDDEKSERPQVWVLPITHTEPDASNEAIEIPAVIKNRLGLDHDRSWIMLDEWNAFRWPGPDVRRTHDGDEASVAYGFLAPNFFNKVRNRFVKVVRARKAKPVRRTE